MRNRLYQTGHFCIITQLADWGKTADNPSQCAVVRRRPGWRLELQLAGMAEGWWKGRSWDGAERNAVLVEGDRRGKPSRCSLQREMRGESRRINAGEGGF